MVQMDHQVYSFDVSSSLWPSGPVSCSGFCCKIQTAWVASDVSYFSSSEPYCGLLCIVATIHWENKDRQTYVFRELFPLSHTSHQNNIVMQRSCSKQVTLGPGYGCSTKIFVPFGGLSRWNGMSGLLFCTWWPVSASCCSRSDVDFVNFMEYIHRCRYKQSTFHKINLGILACYSTWFWCHLKAEFALPHAVPKSQKC